MNNLANSGLDLRTIEVRNLHQIVGDLNFNFKQVLQLSGFKGLTGETGESIIGATGQRGNMWIFAESTRFISLYSTVTTSGQVSLSFLNGELNNGLSSLLLALDVTSLVQNDIVVLPSRDVIQFDSTTNAFISTGIRFADGLSLTEDEVITIVNNILGGLTNKDVYTTYSGVVKNYADNSAGLNTEQNYNSVIDIPVSGSGTGVDSSIFQFTSLKEAVISSAIQNMLITGSPALYHELVQSTMSNKTVDFIAGVDDFGALSVMQNSYNNGILLGHKDADDFSTWGRIYRTEQNLRFLSDYHPTLDVVARLDLGKLGSELYSPKDLKMSVKSGFVSIENYNSALSWFYANDDYVSIGNENVTNVDIICDEFVKIFSDIGDTTQIIGLYNNEVKASTYQPRSSSIINDSTLLVTHNLFYVFQVSINNEINEIIERLETLESQRVYKQQTIYNGSVNANTIVDFGLHVIIIDDESTYTNFPNSFSDDEFSNTAFVKVNRHDNGDSVWLEQEYVHKNTTNNRTLTSKRSAESTNGGGSYVWSGWSYNLDSNNFSFVEGDKVDISTVTFGDGFEITFGHEVHGVSEITSQPIVGGIEHYVLTGITLDTTGHPVTSVSQNLDDWYYTKAEVNSLLTNHIPIGAIIMWSGSHDNIPDGYALCDSSTSGTPDLSGRFVVGYDPNNSDYSTVGKTGGSESVVLYERHLPRHNHEGTTGFSGKHSHTFPGDDQLEGHGYTKVGEIDYDASSTTRSTGGIYETSESPYHQHTFTTDYAGGDYEPVPTIPPYYTVCFIMFVGFGEPTVLSPVSSYVSEVGRSLTIQSVALGSVDSWSQTGLPNGMSINSVTGIITGVPTTTGSFTVQVTASNTQGKSSPLAFNISVFSNTGSAPIITSDSHIYWDIGGQNFYQATASGSPTSWSITGLPDWLNDGSFSSTGDSVGWFEKSSIEQPVGTIEALVSATNQYGTGSQKLLITFIPIDEESVLEPPNLLNFSSDMTFLYLEEVVYAHVNIGGEASSWSATGLLEGLVIDSENGVVSGTITDRTIGTFPITVTATNSTYSSSITYNIIRT